MSICRTLVRKGIVTTAQLETIGTNVSATTITQAIVDRGWGTEEQVLRAVAADIGWRYVELTDIAVDPTVVARFPAKLVAQFQSLPIALEDGKIVVATYSVDQWELLDEFRAFAGQDIEPVLVRRTDLLRLIKETLGVGGGAINELLANQSSEDSDATDGTDSDDMAEEASVVGLLNELLWDALRHRASDVHIEPERQGLVVRYRIDGLLRVEPVPAELHRLRLAIVSRLKIMARLNIAEKRMPQDGRITLKSNDQEVDVRVSVIPMLHGEGVVLRLLDKSRSTISLKQLAMPTAVDNTFRKLIRRPHGIILVTGPTGSGKTSTLYSALSELRSPTTKIVTIEDPVEYHLEGISQIQTHAKIGLTFAAGLRSVLRHDPDVILIGEIRDAETAQSAIQAALTGHLVLSTLHTNDAASAFTRLVDMGVEPYLVASTVQGVLAQRLVRRLCRHCKRRQSCERSLPLDFGPSSDMFHEAVGCRECHGTGFAGRAAIFELLENSEDIRKQCVQRASANDIRSSSRQQGYTSLRQSGWELVRRGETTIEEVLRVAGQDCD